MLYIIILLMVWLWFLQNIKPLGLSSFKQQVNEGVFTLSLPQRFAFPSLCTAQHALHTHYCFTALLLFKSRSNKLVIRTIFWAYFEGPASEFTLILAVVPCDCDMSQHFSIKGQFLSYSSLKCSVPFTLYCVFLHLQHSNMYLHLECT